MDGGFGAASQNAGLPSDVNSGIEAIEMALDTPFRDADDCFRWLYRYGAQPLVLGEDGAHRAAVLTPTHHARLGRHFVQASDDSWDRWLPEGWQAAPAPRYKLYIRPRVKNVQSDLSALLPALCETDGLKVAAQQWMLTRSDCVLVYFLDPNRRRHWVATHHAALAGIKGTTVPFTRALTQAVSIATDPDTANQSWRSTLLRHVAQSILHRQGQAGALSLVLKDLRQLGFDPQTWSCHD